MENQIELQLQLVSDPCLVNEKLVNRGRGERNLVIGNAQV